MSSPARRIVTAVFACSSLIPQMPVVAQAPVALKAAVEILDEPKTIDPATLVPAPLAARVTVTFKDASLKEIVAWLQTEQKLSVVLDKSALKDEGVLISEPHSDQLRDEPLYMLLDRFSALGLEWYMESGLLHLTTKTKADEHMQTISYNLGDLFDSGYESKDLLLSIENASSGQWENVDGVGGQMVLLADLLFVRNTDRVHREIAGLLAALRRFGRRTFTLDAPQHTALRDKLQQAVSVDFQDSPLSAAMQELSRLTGAGIRLDLAALRDEGVRERTPVTLKLTDQKLSTVLRVLLSQHGLDWVLEDGVLWITTAAKSEDFRKSAVFDVRDLCLDAREDAALKRAIQSQTGGRWADQAGEGGDLSFARTGVMVVRQPERVLDEVLQLLENYRAALRASKPRQRLGPDPQQEIITRYYRLPTNMANELQTTLKLLVRPESWKSPERPESVGTIQRAASLPSLIGLSSPQTAPANAANSTGIAIENSVLIVRQTREIHKDIGRLIQKLEVGDLLIEPESIAGGSKGMGGMGGMGGGMGGMGGFGGGFQSVPPEGISPTRQ